MNTTPITKNLFLNGRCCPTFGWYLRNQPINAPPSEGDLFRMEQGKEVGRLARTVFPQGRFGSGGTNDDAARQTQALLSDPLTRVLFEATFVVGSYVVKPDILERDGDGWRLVEVKSNLADTSSLEELIDDLAYTFMVLSKAGVNVLAAELMLICRDYRKGQPASSLFQRIDQTDSVKKRMSEFHLLWETLDAHTASEIAPKPKLIAFCRSCPHFETECLGKGVDHSIFSLPRLHSKRLAELSDQEVVDLRHLPEGFPLTPNQRRVVDCAGGGKPWVSTSLKTAFQELTWPVAYLDFETVMTALPLYDERPPYAQITTQYSLHRRQRPDANLDHAEFLADPMRDCEEELAERLLRDCGSEGSIVVYSGFEKTRIKGLAARFPKLSSDLLKLNERLFDLLRVLQDGYYHAEFRGSYSIKVVLPVLVPELSYDGLAIGNGDTAVARFARAAMGRCNVDELRHMRLDLLAYCKQDTLAMVRLHESLLKM